MFGDEGRTTRLRQLRGDPKVYDWLEKGTGDKIVDEIIGDIYDVNTNNYTIYANSITGNDITGDGSSGNPYQTWDRVTKDIPFKTKWKPTIDLTGEFTIDKDLSFYFYVDNIPVNGKKSVESTHTVTNVVSASEAAGIVVTVAGAGWTPGEHIGKLYKFNSGAANAFHGWIYDNTADTLYISQEGKIVRVPVIGDKLSIFSLDTKITFSKAGSPGDTVGVKSCRFKFTDCKFEGDGFSSQSSWIYTDRCSMDIGNTISANGSFATIETSYIRGTGAIAFFAFQNTTTKIFNGCVIDGEGSNGVFTRDNSTVKFFGETVFARLDNNGISTIGSYWSREADTSWIRFHDCEAGFVTGWYNSKDVGGAVAYSANVANLPPMYGTLTTGYMIDADQLDNWIVDPATNVSTPFGTNACTVDKGVSEGYQDEEKGIYIYGVKDLGNYSIQASYRTATDYVVTKFDYYIGVTDTSVPRAITLPDPSTLITNKGFEIGDESGNAAVNNITITPAAGLINGAASFVINANYQSIKVIQDGTNYFVR